MGSLQAQPVEFGLPVDCAVGIECFVQQGPDTDPGPGVRDPMCGAASYDGHEGWDIRVRWMPDIGVPVVAARDGVVARLRDGIPDGIPMSEAEIAATADQECGNGIVIAHGDGWESQYCHLKRGSISVRAGDRVSVGERIAGIGASGLAQFPHVHFSVRRDGLRIDPLTGHPLSNETATCGDFDNSLMTAPARAWLSASPSAILAAGLSGEVPHSGRLLSDGPPSPLTAGLGPLIVWAWAINIEEGWHLRLRVTDGQNQQIVDHESAPLDRHKAAYLAYAGLRNVAISGDYRLEVQLLDGETILWRYSETVSAE